MKKIIMTLIVLWMANGLHAQTDNSEIRAKVKDVKLSDEFIYSEATSMNSAEDAKEAAMVGIETEANMILAEQNKAREEKKAIWNSAAGKVVLLEYTNGPLYKAMAYIPKNVITEGGAASTETKGTAEAKTETAPKETKEPVQVLEMPVKNETGNEEVKQAKLAELVALPQKPLEDEKKGIDCTMPSAKQFNSKEAENVLRKLTWKSDTPPSVPNLTKELKPLDTVDSSTYNVLTTLLKMDTYENVMLYLEAMKDDGRVMYGRLEKAKSLERAYLIVIKEGKMVTVMNKGGRERVNLKTNQPEDITKYIGYGIIWLQIF